MQGFSQEAKRIVSLAPSLTKMLYLLNAQNELVGCTSYCYIPVNDKKEVVASAIDVNVEKILLQKADLVLATTITKPSILQSLEKLGIKVKVFPITNSFDEICNQLLALGKLTGKEDIAKTVIDKQKARLAVLQKSVPKGQTLKMFFQIGAKPIFTVIPNTFMNDFITFAGGKNVASDLVHGTITRENVLLRNPDVIIIVTMGIVGNEEKTTWESYPNLSAAKRKKIFIVDADKACSPTPLDFVDTLEQLITLIYKK
jgi:iron complex transport system substrate-binding protein